MCIAGTAEVTKAGYPDHFAWEEGHEYFDEASTEQNPVWYMVDIRLTQIFDVPVTRKDLETDPGDSGNDGAPERQPTVNSASDSRRMAGRSSSGCKTRQNHSAIPLICSLS